MTYKINFVCVLGRYKGRHLRVVGVCRDSKPLQHWTLQRTTSQLQRQQIPHRLLLLPTGTSSTSSAASWWWYLLSWLRIIPFITYLYEKHILISVMHRALHDRGSHASAVVEMRCQLQQKIGRQNRLFPQLDDNWQRYNSSWHQHSTPWRIQIPISSRIKRWDIQLPFQRRSF